MIILSVNELPQLCPKQTQENSLLSTTHIGKILKYTIFGTGVYERDALNSQHNPNSCLVWADRNLKDTTHLKFRRTVVFARILGKKH
jgi:hypothetical protein